MHAMLINKTRSYMEPAETDNIDGLRAGTEVLHG